MKILTSYQTIKNFSESIYKEKGSKFLGFAFPVHSEKEAKSMIDKYKRNYHDARHHCYACVIGPEKALTRMNDDGEPSGTAGKPILGQINALNLSDIMVLVVRYFGGILLGTGGLIRAYRTTASLALENNNVVTREITESFKIIFGYQAMNDVMRLLKENHIKPIDQQFDETCSLRFEVPLKNKDHLVKRLQLISQVKVIKKFSTEYPHS